MCITIVYCYEKCHHRASGHYRHQCFDAQQSGWTPAQCGRDSVKFEYDVNNDHCHECEKRSSRSPKRSERSKNTRLAGAMGRRLKKKRERAKRGPGSDSSSGSNGKNPKTSTSNKELRASDPGLETEEDKAKASTSTIEVSPASPVSVSNSVELCCLNVSRVIQIPE